MRITAALATTGLATLGLLALAPAASAQTAGTTVASAVPGWQVIHTYPNKPRCQDAGQQYVREGFNEWKCTLAGPSGEYTLWVR
ncbi:hypothetical protein [Kribbella sp. NPDC023855]|uniref:hypothetical protein n=1 Tax=Kribbella sp. NPDC023855 TaxID=3154698 RepID=UPI00340D5499